MRGRHVVFVVSMILLAAGGNVSGEFAGDYSKLSGIIIPGFASTQLRAWSILDCPYSPLDFNPLDLVWLDTTKVNLQQLAIVHSLPCFIQAQYSTIGI